MSRQRSDETIQTAEYVSIGELVRLTGIRYSTIKFYIDEGFIPYVQEDKKMVRRQSFHSLKNGLLKPYVRSRFSACCD